VNERAAMIRALEALEAGDQSAAADVLLAALEDVGSGRRRVSCPICGLAFTWPGERDGHVARSHGFDVVEAA
jgi:hypothetical protein